MAYRGPVLRRQKQSSRVFDCFSCVSVLHALHLVLTSLSSALFPAASVTFCI